MRGYELLDWIMFVQMQSHFTIPDILQELFVNSTSWHIWMLQFLQGHLSSSTYSSHLNILLLFSTAKRSLWIQKIIFYFICLYFITMSSFGGILIFFTSPWCEHFVFLLDISTLCKKQEWAQCILDDNFFTFSLSEMASLERKIYRTVSNSSLLFFFFLPMYR